MSSLTYLHQSFEIHARKTPKKIAVQFENKEFLTYEQLLYRAQNLAGHIRRLGVGKDNIIPLCMDRSTDMIISMLAVISAGGAYVPLDPNYPEDRKIFIIKEVRAKIVIVSDKYADLNFADAHKISLGEFSSVKSSALQYNILPMVEPSDLAYVIFTSGSTGTPKGVMVEHQNVSSYLRAALKLYKFGSTMRVLSFASFIFDAHILDIFGALSSGACLCIASLQELMSNLLDLTHDLRITFADLTPTVASTLMNTSTPHLQSLHFAGEALPPRLVDSFSDIPHLYNAYGPSEASLGVLSRDISHEDAKGTSVPLGVPIGETQVYILDDSLKQVPNGVVGEICVSGPQVSRGYLNRPDLTAKSFVTNPFNIHGPKLYRTGDRGVLREGGAFEYCGRNDGQIKLNGVRVELGEIEAVISKVDDVSSVAVDFLPVNGLQALVTFFVSPIWQNATDNDLSRLREQIKLVYERALHWAASKLPMNIIPRVWVPLSSLPSTASGKIDKRFLKSQWERGAFADRAFFGNEQRRRPFELPATSYEQALCQSWIEVLGRVADSISVHDDFFALGGDSMRAMQVAACMKVAGYRITASSLLEHSTIRNLSNQGAIELPKGELVTSTAYEPFSLLSLQSSGASSELLALGIQPDTVEDIYGCTATQEAIVTSCLAAPGESLYQGCYIYGLNGNIDVDRFSASWDRLVRLNPILRTRIVWSSHVPAKLIQVVIRAENTDAKIAVEVTPTLEAQARRLSKFEHSALRSPFDLGGHGLCASLIGSAQIGYQFVISIHHVFHDGWTIRVLLDDLTRLYEDLTWTPASRHPFATYIRDVSLNDNEEALSFWLQRLQGASSLPWPRSSRHDHSHRIVANSRLTSNWSGPIEQFSQKFSVTPAAVVRSALALVLSKHADTDDVLFGEVSSGRGSTIGAEHVVGPCIATSLVRVLVEGQSSVVDWIRTSQIQYLAALPHDHIGVSAIMKASGLLDNGYPKLNVLLAYQSLPAVPDAGTLAFNEQECLMTSDLPLTLQIFPERGGHFSIVADYDDILLASHEVQSILDHLSTALSAIIASPGSPLGSISILSEDDRSFILQDWNPPPHVSYEKSTLHGMFEEQAARTPKKIAIQFDQTDFVTYQELNRRASRVSVKLVSAGVGPGSFVPLCMKKSVRQVVAILGILKAGAAYVPIDPEHPPDRKQYILEEVHAQVVITEPSTAKDFPSSVVFSLPIELAESSTSFVTRKSERVQKATSADPVYVIFTSGSTGRPKGVVLHHAHATAFIQAILPSFNFGPLSRILNFANYIFDASVNDIFGALCSGATLCLADKNSLLNDCGEVLTDMRASFVDLTPTVARLLQAEKLVWLDTLHFAGETLQRDVVSQFRSIPRLLNIYGPTEATVSCIWHDVSANLDGEALPSIPIGRPLGQNRVYILDDSNVLCPLGVAGEICIGGPQIARGYLNREELTRQVFLEDPFIPGSRLYRTGDLGRLHKNGLIEYIGRRDSQIKLHGLRIELGEIEAALSQHESATAVVEKATTSTGDDLLVAFVVNKVGTEGERQGDTMSVKLSPNKVLHSSLRQLIEKSLPHYMIPTFFVPLSKLPLSVTGKVDRVYLRRFFSQLQTSQLEELIVGVGSSDTTPIVEEVQNDIQARLRSLWCKVLGLKETSLGINHSFYRFGGDSISAIRLSALCKGDGLPLTASSIASHPTIKQQALLVERSREVARVKPSPSIQLQDPIGEVPLSPIQRQLFQVTGGEIPRYTQSMLFELKVSRSQMEVEAALHILIKHHDALRTRFEHRGHTWGQVVPRLTDSAVFQLVAEPTICADDLNQQMERLVAAVSPEKGICVRAGLFEVASWAGLPSTSLLFVTVHHLVVDLVSWRILIDDLNAILSTQEIVDLPPKTLPFKAWMEQVQDFSKTLTLSDQQIYPENATNLWQPVAKMDLNSSASNMCRVTLSAKNTQDLLGPALAFSDAEPLDVMLASLALAVRSSTISDQITICLEGHGRESWNDELDISNTVGWFTTLYPLEIDFSSPLSTVQVLRRVKDTRRRIKRKGFDYGVIKYLSNPNTHSERPYKPYPVAFNFHGQFQQLEDDRGVLARADLPGVHWSDTGDSQPWFALLNVEAGIQDGQLQTDFICPAGLLSEVQLQSLSDCFLSTLQTIISTSSENPESKAAMITASVLDLFDISDADFDHLVSETLTSASIDLVSVEDIIPCTSLQRGLIAETMRSEGESAYITSRVYEVSDAAAFPSALESVIRKHPILRTKFVTDKTVGVVQVIERPGHEHTNFSIVENLSEDELDSVVTTYQRNRTGCNINTPFVVVLFKTREAKARVLWLMHHALIDAWSMRIVQSDLEDIYDGRHSLFNEVGPSFKSVVQHQIASSSPECIEFWRGLLSETPPTPYPEMPAGASDKSDRREVVRKRVECPLYSLASKHGILPSTTFLYAWAIVLSIHSHQSDVTFGSVMSGRTIDVEGIENVVGPCINTVCLRAVFNPSDTILDALLRFQTLLQDATRHGHVGMTQLQELGLGSITNAFKTIVNFQTLGTDNEASDLPKFLRLLDGDDQVSYPIHVRGSLERNGHIALEIDHSVAHVSTSDAYWLMEHLAGALDFLGQHSDQMIGDIDVTSEHERSFIHKEWNITDYSALEPPAPLLHELFANQVRKTPKKIALECGDYFMSYHDVDVASNKVSLSLRRLGVTNTSMVPLCFTKSIAMITAILAVLKAGACYVPLDPEIPTKRKLFIVDEVRATLILCEEAYKHEFAGKFCAVVNAEGLHASAPPMEASNLQSPKTSDPSANLEPFDLGNAASSPDDLAYIIFTSGSTGLPKGVTVAHRNVSSMILSALDFFDFSSQQRRLSFANYAFDVSVFDIFGTLTSGGCLCLMSKLSMVSDLPGVLTGRRINYLNVTPTVAQLIRHEDIPFLVNLILEGEYLPVDLRDSILDKGLTLFNACGPTEVVVNVFGYRFPTIAPQLPFVSLGKPYGKTRIYVLNVDGSGRFAPIGTIGEIYVSGAQVTPGYLNNTMLTAASFVDDPFHSGELMFRSGDLGIIHGEGVLEHMGRRDFQVKIRGLRIELGEIEEIASSAPGHLGISVEILQFGADKVISVFIVAEAWADSGPPALLDALDGDTLKVFKGLQADMDNACKAALPSYMVPTIWLPVTSIPVNSNGKRERARLRSLATSDAVAHLGNNLRSQRVFEEPTSIVQQTIRQAWATILRLDSANISINDDYFSLGGDSIKALRLVALLNAEKIAVSVLELFKSPTIAALAAGVEQRSDNKTAASMTLSQFGLLEPVAMRQQIVSAALKQAGLHPRDVEDIYPCSPTQSGLIAISAEGGNQYTGRFAYELPNSTSMDHLSVSILDLVVIHPILRTVFVVPSLVGVGALQMVLNPSYRDIVRWTVIDAGIQDNRGTLENLLMKSEPRPFVLGLPYFDVTVVTQSGIPRLMSFTLHHSMYDGISLQTVTENLAQLLQGDNPHIRTVTPYARYIEHLLHTDHIEDLSFWRRELANCKILEYPARLGPNDRIMTNESRFTTATWNSPVLNSFCSEHRVTVSSVVRSAVALALGLHGGSDDVLFGSVTSGRSSNLSGVESVDGPCVATLPIRVKIDSNLSSADFVKQLQAQQMRTLPHETVGLREIIRQTAFANFQDIFQVIMTFQDHHGEFDHSPTQENSLKRLDTNGSADVPLHYPLTLEVEPHHLGCTFIARFNPAKTSEGECKWLLSHVTTALDHILSNPQTPVGNISFVSKDERRLLKNNWSGLPAPPVVGVERLPTLFREQVVNNYHKIALQFENSAFLSFRQLDILSNGLARHLIEMGVVSQQRVPLFFDKSIEMVISMFAIWKAGAAFVPMDPAAPMARKEFVLEELEASHVLTHWGHEKSLPSESHIIPIDVNAVLGRIDWNALTDYWTEDPTPSSLKSDHLAYVMYTSGSTGRPKGVMVEHRNLVSYVAGARVGFSVHPTARVLQFANYTFDAAINDIFVTLFAGATLLLESKDWLMSDLGGAFASVRATYTDLTPTVSSLLSPEDLPFLQQILLAGEQVGSAILGRWLPYTQVINGYGPAEGTCGCTSLVVSSTDLSNVSIGRPFGQNRIYILDERLELAPIGAVGEICVAGPQVSRGYLKRDELTRDNFLQDPFHPQFRLYRTGDLGRLRHDGNLECIGRRDSQIKLHGQRIEAGEVESVIMADSRISQVAVGLGRNAQGTKLVAFITMKHHVEKGPTRVLNLKNSPDVVTLIGDLRRACAKFLPSHMIPSIWIPLSDIIRNNSNKTDHRALGDLYSALDPSTLRTLAEHLNVNPKAIPTSDTQLRMRSIWSSSLGIETANIGIHDSYLDLGGDSITAIGMVKMMREEGLLVTVGQLISNPTIAGLSSSIEVTNEEMDARRIIQKLNDTPPGSRTVFFVHDYSGMVTKYSNLNGIIRDQMYGISDPWLGERTGCHSLTEMAALYIKHIRNIQPYGPYVLAGWSFGGNVALEIAAQLTAINELVSHVILVDSFNFSILSDTPLNRSFGQQMEHNDSLVQDYLSIQAEKAKTLLHAHQLRRYDGPVCLLKARPRAITKDTEYMRKLYQDQTNGWSEVLGALKSYPVRGGHDSVFDDAHVQETGRVIAQILGGQVDDDSFQAAELAARAG